MFATMVVGPLNWHVFRQPLIINYYIDMQSFYLAVFRVSAYVDSQMFYRFFVAQLLISSRELNWLYLSEAKQL